MSLKSFAENKTQAGPKKYQTESFLTKRDHCLSRRLTALGPMIYHFSGPQVHGPVNRLHDYVDGKTADGTSTALFIFMKT